MKKLLQILQLIPFLAFSITPSICMAQGINIQSGGSLLSTGAASLEIRDGNLINNGTYTKGSETVTFSGTAAKTISGASTTDMNNLTVTNTGGITIVAGKKLTVSGTLTNSSDNSGLVIQSVSDGATGTGSLINSTAEVPATVERWMTGNIWHLISPPTTGQIVADFVGDATNGIAKKENLRFGLAPYDESDNTWKYYAHPTAVGSLNVAGKGYQVLRTSDGKVSFKGTVAAADLTVPIVKTSKGWNLIGNPYPCALDINLFLNNTANGEAIDLSYLAVYVANLANNSYTAVNNVSDVKLAAGEAFFVKSASASGNVSFTGSMKSHTSSAFKSATNQIGIDLIAETGNEKATTSIRYIRGMTKGLDPGWDAGQFNGSPSSFAVYTRLVQDNDVNFMLQCLPDNDYENLVIPVGLTVRQGASVSFKLGAFNLPDNNKVYLEDKLTRTFTRLDQSGSSYNVLLASENNGPGRFFLHTNTGITSPTENLSADIIIVPLPRLQKIRISGLVNPPAQAFVYDLNGRLVVTKLLNHPNENEIPLQGVSKGIYLVQIRSAKEITQQKIIWTN